MTRGGRRARAPAQGRCGRPGGGGARGLFGGLGALSRRRQLLRQRRRLALRLAQPLPHPLHLALRLLRLRLLRPRLLRPRLVRPRLLRPRLLLADEPTGNLDEDSGDAVMSLLLDLVRDTGAGLLMVTHSQRLAARLDRRLMLAHGRIA